MRYQNKQMLFDFFDGKISMASMIREDDTAYLYGRYCTVHIFPCGTIDIFLQNHGIVNSKTLKSGIKNEPVSGKRVNKFCDLMSQYEGKLMPLDGEAWFQTKNKLAILDNMKWLGIKAKQNRPNTIPGWLK